MKSIIAILLLCMLSSCNTVTKEPIIKDTSLQVTGSEKIQVLNFATFHMGNTTDAHSTEFDEADKKNQADAKEIARIISKFKPTVICVEVPPSDQEELDAKYKTYINNPDVASSYYGEVGLVAFEVGRLNNLDKLHAIDHRLSYNYNINNELTNEIDSINYNSFMSNLNEELSQLNTSEEGITLLEKLKRMNDPKFLDILISVNADMLAFVGTKDGFEGADEAAKYYQRNLRIYSNLNRIPLTKDDRVFILSGGSHTAFLNEFMKRSAKYEVVNTFDYLN